MYPITTVEVTNIPVIILFGSCGLASLGLLLYVAIEDIRSMTIPKQISYGLLGFYAAINILLTLAFDLKTRFSIGDTFSYYPYANIMAGMVLGTLTTLIVKLSKEKGMGWGDVIYMSLLGLICGFPKSLTALYVAVLSALAYGVFAGVRKKKLSKVRLPFVPFIVLGIVAGLVLGDEFPGNMALLLSNALTSL